MASNPKKNKALPKSLDKFAHSNLFKKIKSFLDLSFCNKTHELNSSCNFAGEAHSLKIEKILFQGKSDYQKVMVFQVHEVQVNFEVTITFFCMLCYLSIFSLQRHDVFCSHQHMARFLFWMELFSSQKGTNVPTKK